MALSLLAVGSPSWSREEWTADALGGWSDRLGLAFVDECEEYSGFQAVFAFLRPKRQSAMCETKEALCLPGQAVTGLQVRSGRRGGGRELYDFQLRCGEAWQNDWLGLRYDVPGEGARSASMCARGEELTGVQVMRGRGRNRDYYNFKLRCDRNWLSKPLGLPFDKLKETRSSSCPMGRAVGGLRVHRGYQDFGSYDTYEFQLQCLPERELREDGPVVHAGVLAELAARLPGVDVRAALTALLAQQRDGGKDEL